MSCYAPSWVKRDTARFERVKRSSGEILEIISPESTAANDADARAFVEAHAMDSRSTTPRSTPSSWCRWRTRVGMIPEPRDHSEKV